MRAVPDLHHRSHGESFLTLIAYPGARIYEFDADGAHEVSFDAIMDRATFDKAQQLLDARGEMSTRKSSTPDYFLTGLLRCTICGSPYLGGAGKNGKGEQG